MSQGQEAIAELQKRFGGRVNVHEAFRALDHELALRANRCERLKQMMCGDAFFLGQVFANATDATALAALFSLDRAELVEAPTPPPRILT